MSGPAKRRAFPRHVAEAELVDSHPVSRSNLRQPSSRSVAGSQRKLSNDLKDDPSDRLNKEEACVDTLTNGYPLSYIDLFYLTHGRFGRYDLRGAELRTMKNHLVDAEKNVRSGEVIPGIHIYHELGNFFE